MHKNNLCILLVDNHDTRWFYLGFFIQHTYLEKENHLNYSFSIHLKRNNCD